MSQKHILILIFCFLIAVKLYPQNNVAIEGIVYDSLSNKALPFASIFIKPANKGFATNEKGEFKTVLPKGEQTFEISFVGYHAFKKTIYIKKNTKLSFYLHSSSVEVDGVNISSKRDDENIRSVDVGTLNIDKKDLEKLPSLMGEPDIMNIIRLTPGVQTTGEGNPGLYVRGGDAGQNLILLDNMTLYNPSHLLGFFPVFNSDIIESASIIKGAIPANYNGRAAAVIDIQMRESSATKLSGSGSIGLLSSDLTLESPFLNNKGSIILSGRKTYLDIIKTASSPFIKSSNNFFNNTSYYFYDGSMKLRYRFGKKTNLYLTAFGGQDLYELNEPNFKVTNNMSWTNACANARLTHAFNSKFYMNIASSKSLFSYDIDARFSTYSFIAYSAINDWKNNVDFTWTLKNKNSLKFGAQYTKHILTPNKIKIDAGEINFKNTNSLYSNEFFSYLKTNINLSKKVSVSGGLRLCLYNHTGPYVHYINNETGLVSDSIVFKNEERIKAYRSLDPNIKFAYVLNNKSSIKASASVAHQYIHLASVGTVSLPTDIWLPSTSFIKPQKVAQVSGGYFRNFIENQFESSVQLYYKKLNNQLDFLYGVLDNYDNTKFEKNIITGNGKAYGAEFFLKKKKGNTTGWISYTISRTLRQFDEFKGDNYFPAKYDRIHDFSFTLNHTLSDKWDAGIVFVYATGNAMTLPAGRYIIQGQVANHYTDVNSFRMPAYHRLDLSANYYLKQKGRFESKLNFSVYNLYNRANPYFIYFAISGNLDNYKLSVAPKQVSLFPILPSVTWSFKF